MKKYSILFFILFYAHQATIYSFSIPKFYHGRIFLDETRFSEETLFSFDLLFAGGTKHFDRKGYTGRLAFTELILQLYQNFNKGFFLHAYLPICSVKLTDVEPHGSHPAIEHYIHQTDIYSPGLFAGWTLNYEETQRLDFIDFTLELGALLPSSKKAVTPFLFPLGYTEKPGFAAAGYAALGALEWLTTGLYVQTIVFNSAAIWSSGAYIKLDHIIPRISFLCAACGDGQNKEIESINPWMMFSLYLSAELDLAHDDQPWLPRIKIFFSKPLKGINILKAGLGGFDIGFDY